MASLKKKISKVVSCPTCAAISAVLAASKVPSPIRNQIAYDSRVKAADSQLKTNVRKRVTRKLTGKALKRSRILQRALKAVNAKARKKDGSLKKGWSQSRIMKEAHRITKKELK